MPLQPRGSPGSRDMMFSFSVQTTTIAPVGNTGRPIERKKTHSTVHTHKPWCLQGAPLQKGSKEETFAALAVTYGLTKEGADLFLEGPMENLEDFRHYFADEVEIDAFVTAMWKPEATTPQEPEEEPEAAPEMTVNCRAKAVAQTAMEFRSSDGPASNAEIFVKTYRIRSALRIAIGCEFLRTLARAFT